MTEKKTDFTLGLIALILAIVFFVAFANDFLMGCGEGYHTATGYVPPDNKGCIFFGAKQ
jgi:hypothetical protein